MGKLTSIAEKCLWALTGAAALALFTHFASPEPEELVIVTQTSTSEISATEKIEQSQLFENIQPTEEYLNTSYDTLPNDTSPATTVPPQNDLVNINTASIDELMTLPGIGEVKAKAILDYREQYGGFASINELLEVSGIGEKTLEKFRDHVTV